MGSHLSLLQKCTRRAFCGNTLYLQDDLEVSADGGNSYGDGNNGKIENYSTINNNNDNISHNSDNTKRKRDYDNDMIMIFIIIMMMIFIMMIMIVIIMIIMIRQ